jgi:hypothetical protein
MKLSDEVQLQVALFLYLKRVIRIASEVIGNLMILLLDKFASEIYNIRIALLMGLSFD